MKIERKKYSNSRRHPRYYRRRTSRMIIRSYQFGAIGSHVFEFEIEDRDLMQVGKQMDGAQQMGSMVLYHGKIFDHKRFFDPIARPS
jgi:hypothetical protein